jgi:uncharacterized protein (DUF1684 family)
MHSAALLRLALVLLLLLPWSALAQPASDSLSAIIAAIHQARAAKDSLLRHDPESPLLPQERPAFAGLRYFPIDLEYRLVGELHVYGRQRQIEVPATDGSTILMERFGRFVFSFRGKPFWLEVYRSLENGIVEIFFRDLTNGLSTYPGGRYARLENLENGNYLLDFNNAYNPYCAYNIAYVCPLPPLQNHLPFAVSAGELHPGPNLAH